MGICELCGAEGRLFKAIVEGTELAVCEECAKHGKVLEEVREPIVEEKKAERVVEEPEEEVIQAVVPDFSEKIRMKREELGLNHEDFAKKISEKESIVHKLETGEFEPPIDTAKKLERILGIKLIEGYKETHERIEKVAAGELTVGDLVKIKKRTK